MRFDAIKYKPCFQGYNSRALFDIFYLSNLNFPIVFFVSAKKIVPHDEEILLLIPSMLRVVDNHINSRYCILLDT